MLFKGTKLWNLVLFAHAGCTPIENAMLCGKLHIKNYRCTPQKFKSKKKPDTDLQPKRIIIMSVAHWPSESTWPSYSLMIRISHTYKFVFICCIVLLFLITKIEIWRTSNSVKAKLRLIGSAASAHVISSCW